MAGPARQVTERACLVGWRLVSLGATFRDRREDLMGSNKESIIARTVSVLAGRPGVRGVALVGSRGSGDLQKIDQYSDADFLICCQDDELASLLKAEWIDTVEQPVLKFPQIMDDEIRVLFRGLFACEFHVITVDQALKLSGPCRLGSYLASGFLIQHDPDSLLAGLANRIQPEPPGWAAR